MTTTETRLDIRDERAFAHQSEACDEPRNGRIEKTSTCSGRSQISTFLHRHPVLHGLFLELRNFSHRIQVLLKRGCIRPIQTGLVYQESIVPGFLELNIRTQARNEGIRKLLSDSPWLTGEDFALFLLGWEAAEEWCKTSCIADRSVGKEQSLKTLVAADGQSYAALINSAMRT